MSRETPSSSSSSWRSLSRSTLCLLLLSNVTTLILSVFALWPYLLLQPSAITDSRARPTATTTNPSSFSHSQLAHKPPFPSPSSSPSASPFSTPLTPDLCDPSLSYGLDIPPSILRYCNAANSTTFPYRRPVRYSRHDVAVSLLTVDTHKFTRDESVLHAWLNRQRLPFGYLGVAIERSPLLLQPTLPIPLTSDVFISNLNKTLVAMRELHRLHPHKAWYVSTSDDAFFDVDALLLKLDAVDSEALVYAGGAYVHAWPCWNTGREVDYIGGGSGFALSHGLMERYGEEIEGWMARVWLSAEGVNHTDHVLGDIMAACFMDEMGIRMTHIGGGHGAVPAGATSADPNFPADHRWWAWHYVPQHEMLDVDLFFTLQRVDQMHRHAQLDELARFSRDRAMEHWHQQKRSLTLVQRAHGVPE